MLTIPSSYVDQKPRIFDIILSVKGVIYDDGISLFSSG